MVTLMILFLNYVTILGCASENVLPIRLEAHIQIAVFI